MADYSRGSGAAGVGDVLDLIRSHQAMARSDIARLTGLSRATLATRLQALLDRGLVVEAGTDATGGRPAEVFKFNAAAGVLLTADVGATRCRAGLVDLGGAVLAERSFDLRVADGPESCLAVIHDVHGELLSQAGVGREAIWGMGLGVPGPVDAASRRLVSPPIMPGWGGFDISAWFAERVPGTVVVDNDVNAMALGESTLAPGRSASSLIYVKVGTGIGAGLILDGRIYRGAQGAAGDIGHVRVESAADAEQVVCHCGNTGCLEAIAGGGALAAKLADAGLPAHSARDVVSLVTTGEPAAIHAVREAGRHIGEVLASIVNVINPQQIVVGGSISLVHEHLLAGIREVVYRRSTVLATQQLRISEGKLGSRAGTVGCAVLAMNEVLSPAAIEALIERSKRSA